MYDIAPRFIGTPRQFYCDNQLAFNRFIKFISGNAPLFVSTYVFPTEQSIIFDNLFYDIDAYSAIREKQPLNVAYEESKKIVDFHLKLGVPVLIAFSGGKGFHIFPFFKEQLVKTDEEKAELKTLMYSTQIYISEKLELTCFDAPTFGRLRFLVRYPTAKYIRPDNNGKPVWNGLYCRALTVEEFNKGLPYILKLAVKPGKIPTKPHSSITLKEFTEKLPGFKIVRRAQLIEVDYEQFAHLKSKSTGVLSSIYDLGVPCLIELAKKSNPSHFEKIELVSWMKFLKYSDESIVKFLSTLGWNRYDERKTKYQVSKIKPRFPSCHMLKDEYGHYCHGCTLFGDKK